DAPAACFEELSPGAFQRFGQRRRLDLQLCGDILLGTKRVQVPAAFEVRLTIETEAARVRRPFLLREQRLYLIVIPDVELAFMTFRVGVQGRPVAAFGRLHVADDPL